MHMRSLVILKSGRSMTNMVKMHLRKEWVEVATCTIHSTSSGPFLEEVHLIFVIFKSLGFSSSSSLPMDSKSPFFGVSYGFNRDDELRKQFEATQNDCSGIRGTNPGISTFSPLCAAILLRKHLIQV